jgi:hypothetical protein
MTDVLDRLRVANPVTDLDAVRRGVAPLPPAPKRRRRRASLVLAGAAILAGAVALVSLPEGDTRATDEVAATRRALDPRNSILHVVMRTTKRGPGDSIGTSSEEMWIGPDGRGRLLSRHGDGSVAGDEAIGGSDEHTGAGNYDPLTAARWEIAHGRLRPAGKTAVHGTPALRYRGRRTTWYFDARSFRPLAFITDVPQAQLTARTEFLRYERLPDNAANRKLLTPPRVIPLR